MSTTYVYGTGRRKTAVARVRLLPGDGSVVVNGNFLIDAESNLNRYSVSVLVAGGGVSGQLGAIRHGISRALLTAHPNARAALREAGLLTRDPRAKERKKYGLKKARKAPQYTKR